MLYRSVAKPLFFSLDPETAHHLVVDGLGFSSKIPGMKGVIQSFCQASESPELATKLFGVDFPHPIGLAAGLDKNAVAVEGFSRMGFGFMEVGTVTPVGQAGNDQPRLFRLPPDEALINRMGFNNEGADAMATRLSKLRERRIPVAVNIGKNKVTPNELAHEDYRTCMQKLYVHGDFFVVNISSPNTPDLRALQHGDELRQLLLTVVQERDAQAAQIGEKPKAVLVKLAPDMTDEQLALTVETIVGSGVSGIIATNTTLSRDGLHHPNAKESGGLSGKPLTERSTEVVRQIYLQTKGEIPIIGSGGIFTAKDAYDKIRAGASLVEIYTALIYEGPTLLRSLTKGLRELLLADGFAHISEAVGADHR